MRDAPVSAAWSEPEAREDKIHQIHLYPARFPAFIVERALEYAAARGVEVTRVGDVFCGSGTVTQVAGARNLEFWGCDINPVATLIARVKSARGEPERFNELAADISANFDRASSVPDLSPDAVSRLAPWYRPDQFGDLAKLRNAIGAKVPASDPSRAAFDCAFSAIVKPASQWRKRSVKPAMDARKAPTAVLQAFVRQCDFMSDAWAAMPNRPAPSAEILDGDVNTIERPNFPIDLIITSPPYATSYEYADVHQLSALWLGYADDHRRLRAGVIGTSTRRTDLGRALRHLNSIGMQVVFSLFEKDRALAEAMATYFLDMQKAVGRCHEFLRPGGICVFVVGNTQLNGVRIDNANHMVESLLAAGFTDIRVVKRSVTNKPNTPYRHPNGRLSSQPTGMHIYAEEFVLMAERR
ncbi:class I SAM-dependent methyltransferase [Phenylobacterium sp.]|uniref:class I SAM-dependent methyltransferase n=1 Tax=Phenylobacterium sp. TaxID=1871053 RepID=UPI0025D90BD1|nr:class I SAM-dependent methyltransferase [Phenylobacterium sp.]